MKKTKLLAATAMLLLTSCRHYQGNGDNSIGFVTIGSG